MEVEGNLSVGVFGTSLLADLDEAHRGTSAHSHTALTSGQRVVAKLLKNALDVWPTVVHEWRHAGGWIFGCQVHLQVKRTFQV